MGLVEDLSAAFVAFTVEVDDAVEARRGSAKGPWLVSLAMYKNCMQWLPEDGLGERELLAAARTPTDLNGMKRWGYVEVDEKTVRPTRRVEEPECRPGPVAVPDLGLDSLLARPLTAFALEYEAGGRLSLALQANLLAVLGGEPRPLRELPDATGIHRAQTDNAVEAGARGARADRRGRRPRLAAPHRHQAPARDLARRGEAARAPPPLPAGHPPRRLPGRRLSALPSAFAPA